MNPVSIFETVSAGVAVATSIAGQIGADVTQFEAGQEVDIPPIKTYIAGKHVEIDITVKPIS